MTPLPSTMMYHSSTSVWVGTSRWMCIPIAGTSVFGGMMPNDTWGSPTPRKNARRTPIGTSDPWMGRSSKAWLSNPYRCHPRS